MSQKDAEISEALSASLSEIAGKILPLRDETGLYGVVNELDTVMST